MDHWTKQCEIRHVNLRLVLEKLSICQDAGVDVDRLPGIMTVGDVLRLSVEKIREVSERQHQ